MSGAERSPTGISPLSRVNPAAVSGFQQEDAYDKKRPTYTDEAVDFIIELLKAAKLDAPKDTEAGVRYDVVEVGSGTGKFTLSFIRRAEKQIKYLATEPLPNMLGIVQEKCPAVSTLECAADKLKIPDSSAKVVVAAQSFHWFDNIASVTEINRVLAPKGKLVMIWNSRDVRVPWLREVDDILDGMYRDKGVPRQQHLTWKRVFDEYKGFGKLQHVAVSGPSVKGSVEEILAYFSTISVLSSSADNMTIISQFIRRHPDLEDLSEITIPYVTDIYWCDKQI